ncbi:hypothetical protein H2203_008737 [Taxawa tesnikishii (nom. ined.)]|nr:hypothetical protein H2203_008737 [Dothideales sp. JES 119]
MKDLTTDNITENVHDINAQCQNRRVRFLFERLVTHLHDFARETRLSTDEWMTACDWLTDVGQISTDLRREMILLSDTLGLSALVDAIDHPRSGQSTEGTVLGPFHTHDAREVENGYAIHKDPDGIPLLVVCTIKDQQGKPIPKVQVDVWEGDSHGNYDVQYPDRDGPDGRGILFSEEDGTFWFKCVKPVPYPIPMDGPVYQMLQLLGRHPNRPGHHSTPRGKYIDSDPVFGVKESLIVDITTVSDPEMAKKYKVPEGTALLTYDFVLITVQDTLKLRKEKAVEAIKKMGKSMEDFEGLPILDVD